MERPSAFFQHDKAATAALRQFVSSASFQTPSVTNISAWADHAPFAFWLVSAARPECVVELGVYHGFSYLVLCQAAAALDRPPRCFGVDNWVGDEHSGFYGDDVYHRLKNYHDARYYGFSELIRASFDDALPSVPDGSIDLLHIDGRHFYEDVKQDFEAWGPKLSDRAVVLFHDTNVRERDFGVWKLWEQLSCQFPAMEFLHGYGLGVLGYGSSLPDPLLQLFAAAKDEELVHAIRGVYARLGAISKERVRFLIEADEHAGWRESGG
jgi:hypothetical protein